MRGYQPKADNTNIPEPPTTGTDVYKPPTKVELFFAIGEKCKWIMYDHQTMCPQNHADKCDGTPNKPYWRIPINTGFLKYCPYCGKEIDYSDIKNVEEADEDE